jgi:hypothetical protein
MGGSEYHSNDTGNALAERALGAEMDYHLGSDDQAGNSRNGYGRKSVRARHAGGMGSAVATPIPARSISTCRATVRAALIRS